MTNQQRMSLIKSVYNLIFTCKSQSFQQWQLAPKPAGYESIITLWVPRTFVNGTVRGIDININDNGRILHLRFMEQNLNKKDKMGNLSENAIRAHNGEFIMWAVDRKPEGGFLGSIQNGTWIASQMRAYAPAQYNAAGAVASHTEFTSESIQDVPGNMPVPEYVVETMSGINPEDYALDNFDPGAYDEEESNIGDPGHDVPVE